MSVLIRFTTLALARVLWSHAHEFSRANGHKGRFEGRPFGGIREQACVTQGVSKRGDPTLLLELPQKCDAFTIQRSRKITVS